MNVKQIVIAHLKAIGADGLCNEDEDCGCPIDDLSPCPAGYMRNCIPASHNGNRLRPMETPTEEEETHL